MALIGGTARRYAEAAFQVAQRDGTLEAWLAALELARDRLGDAEAARVLGNPAVAADARVEIMHRLLGDEVAGSQRNLLALLIRRGRFEQLPSVVREFRRLRNRSAGIVEAVVTSAVALDEAERLSLGARLESLTGSGVEMELRVDPALLGGLQVRIGDRLIDGSVRGRLERLRATVSTTAI